MRLDEWQKWLDSQFLETEEGAAPSAYVQEEASQPALPPGPTQAPDWSVSVSPPNGAQSAQTFNPNVRPYNPPTPDSTASAATHALEEPAPPAAPPPAAAPMFAARDADSADAAPVPSIENYLPFLRPRKDTTPENVPPVVQEEAVSLVAQPNTPVSRDAAAEATEPVGVDPPDAMEGATAPGEPPEPPAPARRLGPYQRRPKLGRNTQAELAATPMGADEVWNLAPRHLRTLVSMTDDEVTQHSYKRSFKESRIELIERLLDPSLSLEDTARLLNVCPTTVRRYTNRGLLRHQRTVGDQRRFKLSDVLSFLETQSQIPPPQER